MNEKKWILICPSCGEEIGFTDEEILQKNSESLLVFKESTISRLETKIRSLEEDYDLEFRKKKRLNVFQVVVLLFLILLNDDFLSNGFGSLINLTFIIFLCLLAAYSYIEQNKNKHAVKMECILGQARDIQSEIDQISVTPS